MSKNKRLLRLGILRTIFVIIIAIAFPLTAWYDLVRWDMKNFAIAVESFIILILILSIMLNFDFNPVRWILDKIKKR